MSGGKETPRQKMIGLMYLVLLALLAMNVSKSILEAFVAIEENIQIANENEFARGEEKKNQLMEVAQDKSNPAVAERAAKYLKDVDKIEKATAAMIKFIDECKFKIMVQCGEAITVDGKNVPGTPEEAHLISQEYDPKKAPCKPTRMHLDHIHNPDKYDEPMFVMGISESVAKPTGDGLKLWDDYKKFRKEIIDILVKSSSTPENGYKLKVGDINKFSDKKGDKLLDLVDEMFAKGGKVDGNEIDDLKKIYASLSKNEIVLAHEQEVHWIGKTFDHNPQVAGLASLSSIEKEILTARADAIALIRSRVGGGEYSFNKVEGFAFGDVIANSGDEVEVSVMMAAFDSDKQPEVKPSVGSVSEVKDGIGKVKVKVSGGQEMVIKGTVGIAKKNGTMTYKDWTHTIKIMKPQGTVSLPEMNVLYRGYKNRIEGVASGYDQTILAGNGVTLTKDGTSYIGSPGAGRECSITVSGKNSVTNKTVSLGQFKFRVSNLPPPQVYLGTIATGATVGKSAIAGMTKLFAKYPPEIPLAAEFSVSSWEVNVAGAPRPESGTGPTLTDKAMSLLKQAKPGSKVSISAKYKGMGYAGNMASIITVQ